jgi:hypothetical protein
MLTHNDLTVSNALEIFEEVKGTGLEFIGCKDIGLQKSKLKQLFSRMKRAGLTTFLEVVSSRREDHFAGVDKAIELKADYLVGGMPQFVAETQRYLKKRKAEMQFFPYIGKITDHPCILQGSVKEIVENGVEIEKMGFQGANLLLYRYPGNTDLLLNEIVKTLQLKLVVAGSIDSLEKIDHLKRKGVWAFTIGGAILERRFSEEENLASQIASVLEHLR